MSVTHKIFKLPSSFANAHLQTLAKVLNSPCHWLIVSKIVPDLLQCASTPPIVNGLIACGKLLGWHRILDSEED